MIPIYQKPNYKIETNSGLQNVQTHTIPLRVKKQISQMISTICLSLYLSAYNEEMKILPNYHNDINSYNIVKLLIILRRKY